jgi:hypothetical protein
MNTLQACPRPFVFRDLSNNANIDHCSGALLSLCEPKIATLALDQVEKMTLNNIFAFVVT